MASKYQRYSKYKNTDVNWLGEIPADWDIMQLKRTVNGCVNGIWGAEPKKMEVTQLFSELQILIGLNYQFRKMGIRIERLKKKKNSHVS